LTGKKEMDAGHNLFEVGSMKWLDQWREKKVRKQQEIREKLALLDEITFG
jgi:hypothetical protein